MSDFEQWLKTNYPDYPPPLSEIWNAAIASMQGEAVAIIERSGEYDDLNEIAYFGDPAYELPEGTKLFTYPPSAASKIAEQDARIKELEQQLEVARKGAERCRCLRLLGCAPPFARLGVGSDRMFIFER